MKHIHRQVLEHLSSGAKVVLATVTRSSGSTPQKPGSSALFGRRGLIAGTVGGGLLEASVQSLAREALDSGLSGQHVFNLDSSQGEEGAHCGGEATVLIDADPGAFLKVFEDLERTIAGGSAGILGTIIEMRDDGQAVIRRFWIPGEQGGQFLAGIQPDVQDAVAEALRRDTGDDFLEFPLPAGHKVQERAVFLQRIRPLPRLIIAGAGHVGRAVAHLGRLLEFEITVVDDRKDLASKENIPDADHLVVRDMGQAMREIKLTGDSYVVIVTRGHHHDAEALRPCIGSGAAYVGMIGSRHKVAVMRQEFLDKGWATPEQWDSVHTPIGLEIGSETVQEIAVSIAAQLVMERHRKRLEDEA